MARDSSLYVRKACLRALKQATPLTAIVPASRIYTANVLSGVVWPFIMYGDGEATPLQATCLDGISLPLSFTAYAKPKYIDDNPRLAPIETAEDQARKIAAEISSALDRRILNLDTDYEAKAHVRWASGLCRRAGAESDAWQAIVRFTARVIS